jgi:hypothetical protein
LSATGAATASGTQTVTVTDDDSATVSISAGVTAVEGGATGATAATLNVTTNGVAGGVATLATAVTATLAGNADYSASTVTFAIGAGNLNVGNGNLVVTATQDTLVEGTETFPLQTLTVTGAATAGGTGQTITITDDDQPSSRFFRIYQQNSDFHFFTNSLSEFNAVVAQGNTNEATGRAGFGVITTQLSGTAPLHRIYVPSTGAHYYTFNDAERDALVASGGGGSFIAEPDMGFIYTTQVPGTVEVFRLYNLPRGVHLFTESVFERDSILAAYGPSGNLAANAWRLESSLGFAVSQGAGTFTTGGATQVPARRAAARESAEHLVNVSRNTSGGFNQFGSLLNTVSVDSSSTVASLLSGQQPSLAIPTTASQIESVRQESRLPSLSNSVAGDLTDSDLDNFWGNVGVGDQSDSFWHLLN